MSDIRPPHDASAVVANTRRRILWGSIGGGTLIVVAALLAWWAMANMSPEPGAAPAPSASTASPAPTAVGSAAASSSPTASRGESAPTTPSAEPVASQDPGGTSADGEVPAPVIASFAAASGTASCDDDRSDTAPLDFAWRTSGADATWIGVGTSDAAAQPFATVAPSHDHYTDLEFECSQSEQLYTLTARGPGGTVSASVTVVRLLP